MSRLERAVRLRARIDALAVSQALDLGAALSLPDEELAALMLIAVDAAPVLTLADGDEWLPGARADAGVEIFYAGGRYRAIIPHLTQPDWPPDATPALWRALREELAPWRQPQGAHDAYSKGDRVTHGGAQWESDIDNNTWEPGVYGWKRI